LYDIGRSSVEDLAEETDEIAWLFTEENGKAVLLHKERGLKAIDIFDEVSRIGQHHHLHDHAAGKAILAHLPETEVEAVIDGHGLPKRTPQTITSPDRLLEELEEVRETGVAVNRGELLDKGREVGAPVVYENQVVGAVSISGPAERLHEERLETELKPLVRGASNEIELNLLNISR
jgi:DNA-binding IclR family transcriptional regulator